jgi:hypothetical protein
MVVLDHSSAIRSVASCLAELGFEVYREYRVYYQLSRYVRLDVVGVCTRREVCRGMVVVVEVETEGYIDPKLIDRLRVALEHMKPRPTHIFILTWRALTYSKLIEIAVLNRLLNTKAVKIHVVSDTDTFKKLLDYYIQKSMRENTWL